MAQSAADKATARQVATEGIKLYEEGKYEEALDRLKRAQALYSAPPHLLYIARTQTKLPEPQLVEAAENYRLLVSTDLGPAPPPAFVRAVEDGKKELEELEPRIPALQIDVSPKDAKDIELTIDGAPVSSAVIGISRPINPGKRVIAVSAPGYARAEKTVEVAEAAKMQALLQLEPTGAPGVTAGAPAPEEGKGEASNDKKPGLVGFMAGLRLGVAVPGGSLGTVRALRPAQQDVSTSEVFKTGVGIEIHGGVRFAQLVTAALFAELAALRVSDELAADAGQTLENTGSSSTAGVKIMVGTPRGRLGGFGEIGFGFAHEFQVTSKLQDSDCIRTITGTGPALRLGGGAVFPIGDLIHIVPFGGLSFSTFNHRTLETEGTCPASTPDRPLFTEVDQDVPENQQAMHTLLFLGVGGDFVFGSDLKK